MKKLTALLLALSMVLSLASCGAKTPDPTPTPAPADGSVSQAPTESVGEASSAADASDGAESSAVPDASASEEVQTPEENISEEHDDSAVRTLNVNTGTVYMSQWDENDTESTMPLVEVVYPAVLLGEETASAYPELAAELAARNEHEKTEAEESFPQLLSDATAHKTDSPDDFFAAYSSEAEWLVRRSDDRVLSLLCNGSSYQGGVHGYYSSWGYSFDTATGKELQLSDVITDLSRLPDLIAEKIQANYSDISFLSDPAEYLATYFTGDEPLVAWVLDYNGVTFFFNPYEIASYADGIQTVTLSFAEYPDLFVPQYMEVPESYAVTLDSNQEFYFDVDNDGALEVLQTFTDYGEYDALDGFTVNISGKATSVELYCYRVLPTLIHMADGKNYLYVMTTSDNDYVCTRMLDLSSGEAVLLDEEFGGGFWTDYRQFEDFEGQIRSTLNDPNEFPMFVHTDAFSTSAGIKLYHVGEDGLPVSDSPWFNLVSHFTLTLLQPLEFTFVDEINGEETGTVVLAAGEQVETLRTDNETFVDFRLPDGSVGRVQAKLDEYPMPANGIPADEVFEGMMFAG